MSKQSNKNSTSVIRSLIKTVSSLIKDETFRSSILKYSSSCPLSNFLLDPNINPSSKSFYYDQLVEIINQLNNCKAPKPIYNKKSIALIALKFQKILSNEIQTDIFNRNIAKRTINKQSGENYEIFPRQLYCFHCHHSTQEAEHEQNIVLNTSLFPTIAKTWDSNRLIQALSKISLLNDQPFECTDHHISCFIEEINLIIIQCGNHSSSVGLLEGNGQAKVVQTLNIKNWFNDYYFDGHHFIHTRCGNISSNSEYYCLTNNDYQLFHENLGWIYEISRLLFLNDILPASQINH